MGLCVLHFLGVSCVARTCDCPRSGRVCGEWRSVAGAVGLMDGEWHAECVYTRRHQRPRTTGLDATNRELIPDPQVLPYKSRTSDAAVILCYSRTSDLVFLLCYSRTSDPAVLLCYRGTSDPAVLLCYRRTSDLEFLLCYGRTSDTLVLLCYSRTSHPAVLLCYSRTLISQS